MTEQKARPVAIEDLAVKANRLYESTSPASMMRACMSDGASAVALFRVSEFLCSKRLVPIGVLISKLNKVINGIVIGRGASIGPGFVIQHPVGVVINSRAKLGRNCLLQGGVVIGANATRKSPVLGDNVDAGAGAKIIGDVNIGDEVQIGANAVVVSDLPAGVTAVGVPAKPLIKAKGSLGA